MTEQVSAGGLARRTRRRLLAGGTGALAVLTADALARPAPAAAANGGAVLVGQNNDEMLPTLIANDRASLACSNSASEILPALVRALGPVHPQGAGGWRDARGRLA
jgi:hypothetical protein